MKVINKKAPNKGPRETYGSPKLILKGENKGERGKPQTRLLNRVKA